MEARLARVCYACVTLVIVTDQSLSIPIRFCPSPEAEAKADPLPTASSFIRQLQPAAALAARAPAATAEPATASAEPADVGEATAAASSSRWATWLPADLEEDHVPAHAGAWAHYAPPDDDMLDHHAPVVHDWESSRDARL